MSGLELVAPLLIVRNPAEQVISLYKHRAKDGVKKILKNGYLKITNYQHI